MIGPLLALMLAAPAPPRVYQGDTYKCHFPKAGLVVINTREPGSKIVWRGKTYNVSGGSDFYANDQIYVMFGPKMRWWEFGEDGDRDTNCSVKKNRG